MQFFFDLRSTNPLKSSFGLFEDLLQPTLDVEAKQIGEDAETYDPLTKLFRACVVALRLPTHADGYQPRQLPFWSVGNAGPRISRMLERLSGGAQLEAFLPEILGDGQKAALRRRAAHAATLIAGLELARSGGVTHTLMESRLFFDFS